MIKRFILTTNLPLYREIRSSIKSIEVEERFDLLFHRPLGLLIAKVAKNLGLTPLQLSFLSLITGLASGVLFYWQDNIYRMVLACFLLTLSAIFDSSDGQLARMTGNSSVTGMIIDGIIDSAVFVFVYTFACLYLFKRDGEPLIFLLAALSGFANTMHSLIYDFYKNEMLYHYEGFKAYRTPEKAEVREKLKEEKGILNKLKNLLYYDYIKKQYWCTLRKAWMKERFAYLSQDSEVKDKFRLRYRERQVLIMRLWALFGGTNIHRTLMMAFALFAAFDIYLWANLIGLTFPIVILVLWQNKLDRKLLNEFKFVS